MYNPVLNVTTPLFKPEKNNSVKCIKLHIKSTKKFAGLA
jgi:hypothetical protein